MGFMTLSDFRVSVLYALGEKAGVPRPLLDIWVNQGYVEVARKRRFDALLGIQTLATIDGTREYTLSTRTYAVGFIKDLTNKRLLRQSTGRTLTQADRTVEEQPLRYFSHANKVWLDPTPNGVYDFEVWAYQEPTPLTTPQQTTVLAAYIDPIVEAFAKYYALQNSGRPEEARNWYLKAGEMLNNTPDDEAQRYMDNDFFGANVAWDEDDFVEVP